MTTSSSDKPVVRKHPKLMKAPAPPADNLLAQLVSNVAQETSAQEDSTTAAEDIAAPAAEEVSTDAVEEASTPVAEVAPDLPASTVAVDPQPTPVPAPATAPAQALRGPGRPRKHRVRYEPFSTKIPITTRDLLDAELAESDDGITIGEIVDAGILHVIAERSAQRAAERAAEQE